MLMSLCVEIYLSVCLCLLVSVSDSLSAYICFSVCLWWFSLCPCVSLSPCLCPSVLISACLCLYLCLSWSLSLCVCVPVCLSLFLPVRGSVFVLSLSLCLPLFVCLCRHMSLSIWLSQSAHVGPYVFGSTTTAHQ